jgi:hypothetical protein
VGPDMQQQQQKRQLRHDDVTPALDVPSGFWTQSKWLCIFSYPVCFYQNTRLSLPEQIIIHVFYCNFLIICRYSFSWLCYLIQGSSFLCSTKSLFLTICVLFVYIPISLRIVFTPVGDFLVSFAVCYRNCYCGLLLPCVLWMKYSNWTYKKVKLVSRVISQYRLNLGTAS